MRFFLCAFIAFLFAFAEINAGELYSEAYGKKENPAIIFLHGGPGYNSFSFEQTTAIPLSEKGFFVVVYDQRGSGRSGIDTAAKFTYDEAINDLLALYRLHELNKATLIGHSFGGSIAIKFAAKHPDRVNRLVLVGAPIIFQQTFTAIRNHCRRIYTEENPAQLKYMDMLDIMDTLSLDYSSYCFMHAMSAGLYKASNPAPEAEMLMENLKKNPEAKWLSNMTRPPVLGFFLNEKYTSLRLDKELISLKQQIPINGFYGTEDGLFDEKQLGIIENAIGKENLYKVENSSHSVFIDQHLFFLTKLQEFLKG